MDHPDYLEGPAPPPPERIGGYKIEKILGSGAEGAVYLAWDSTLRCRFAIKVPVQRPGEAETLFTQRQEKLIDEARTAKRLGEKRGIVTVYGLHRTKGNTRLPDGTPYVVMKYIKGRSLASLMASIAKKKQKPAFSWSARLTARVARLLNYAHLKGVVHRDLKPQNILIDNAGEVWLADFGLAVDFHECREWPCAGTPGYWSPEQFERAPLDGRTDIWSLGVIFYQLLTGRLPFGRSLNVESLLTAPIPPRQFDSRIPEELERICLKCLSVDPKDRYATAGDLARDLRRWRPPERGPIEHYRKVELWDACTQQFCPGKRPSVHPANQYVPAPAEWARGGVTGDLVADLYRRLAEGEKRLAIGAEDGQGRTFLLWHLALRMVSGPKPGLTPIVFPLRELNPNSEFCAVDQIESFVRRKFPDLDVKQCLRDGDCVLILDGLDEIPYGVRAPGEAFRQLLGELSRFPDLAVVVSFGTAAPGAITQDYSNHLPGFEVATLRAWDFDQFAALLQRSEQTGLAGFSGGWRVFYEKVVGHPRLRKLLGKPLTCRLIMELGEGVLRADVHNEADLCSVYQALLSVPSLNRRLRDVVERSHGEFAACKYIVAADDAGTGSDGLAPLSVRCTLLTGLLGAICPDLLSAGLRSGVVLLGQCAGSAKRKVQSCFRKVRSRLRGADRPKERFVVPEEHGSSDVAGRERMRPSS